MMHAIKNNMDSVNKTKCSNCGHLQRTNGMGRKCSVCNKVLIQNNATQIAMTSTNELKLSQADAVKNDNTGDEKNENSTN